MDLLYEVGSAAPYHPGYYAAPPHGFAPAEYGPYFNMLGTVAAPPGMLQPGYQPSMYTNEPALAQRATLVPKIEAPASHHDFHSSPPSSGDRASPRPGSSDRRSDRSNEAAEPGVFRRTGKLPTSGEKLLQREGGKRPR
jgi:hypothetical protein